MPGKPRTIQQTAPGADANLLAASATSNFYIRHIKVTNATGTAATANIGVGATLVGVAGAIVFGQNVPANSVLDIPFGGAGRLVQNTNIRSFSGTASALNVTMIYDEEVV